jgi:hypothetical protein
MDTLEKSTLKLKKDLEKIINYYGLKSYIECNGTDILIAVECWTGPVLSEICELCKSKSAYFYINKDGIAHFWYLPF